MKKWLILICFVLLTTNVVQATHIVGGEFKLSHVSGYNYKLNMYLYFDIYNGSPGAKDYGFLVGIYSKTTNTEIATYAMDLTQEEELDYIEPTCARNDLRTNKISYTSINNLNLHPSIYKEPGGYYISWSRCCRNYIITNITQPDITPMTFYMEFAPTATITGNSSPALPDAFAEYACTNNWFRYSFKSTDADGDSLAYKLAVPLKGDAATANFPSPDPAPGPYSTVTWLSSYNVNNMIPGSPALRVDPITGLMEVNPSITGLFVFAVKVEEYRNGIKIGEVRREYQLKVISCPVNIPPTVTLLNRDSLGNEYPYVENDTIYVRAKDNNCYDLKLNDTNINQQLSLKFVPVNFEESDLGLQNGQMLIQRSTDTLRSTICWDDCIEDYKPYYKMYLIASDNGCSIPLRDTITAIFKLEERVNTKPVIKIEPQSEFNITADSVYEIRPNQEIKFDIITTDPDSTFLALHGRGKNFSLSDYGMTFTNKTGVFELQSPFSWTPQCFHNIDQLYTIQFWAVEETCQGLDSVLKEVNIRVLDINDTAGVFLPPNVITPNGDGTNDYFEIPNLPLDVCGDWYEEIVIYNRWGNRLFTAKGRDFRWDAFKEPDGVYFYYVKYTRSVYKGHISIIR